MTATDIFDSSHREDVCQKPGNWLLTTDTDKGMTTVEFYSLKKNEALEIKKESFRTSEDMG